MSNQPARRFDRSDVAGRLEKRADRIELRPQLAGSGQIQVLDQQSMESHSLRGHD
jgi:hypothetical protein